ncbi:tyrosine-protein phosphatase [Microbacter sp. GSS18]|nr:tyrosine-protein phosphatase [Microbacter sp. GSS18]
MALRHLDVDGLANARDLGGLARTGGATTPTGVFFRSEALDRVTDDGWAALCALGVTTVVDLRRPEERTAAVPDGIDRVVVDLDGTDRGFWDPLEADGRWGTPLYYLDHLERMPGRMRAVLDALVAAREGAVLFHCGAGWDRTGFVSAVLLRALDVTTEAAAADYLASFGNAEAMESLRGSSSHVTERLAVLERHGHTPESAFTAVYEGIDLDAWFAAADVSAAARAGVRTWRGAVA